MHMSVLSRENVLELQNFKPTDTLDQAKYGIGATLNEVHYCADVRASRRVQVCKAKKYTTIKSLDQTLKVAEVYLYIGDRSFETVDRVRNNRRDHCGVLWLCTNEARCSGSR